MIPMSESYTCLQEFKLEYHTRPNNHEPYFKTPKMNWGLGEPSKHTNYYDMHKLKKNPCNRLGFAVHTVVYRSIRGYCVQKYTETRTHQNPSEPR